MNANAILVAQRTGPITSSGAKGFLDWLKKYQPYHFERVRAHIPKNSLSGLGIVAATGDTTPALNTPVTPSWVDTFKNVIMAGSQAWLTKEQIDAQKKILDMQLDRAKAGLPPLDIDPASFGLPAPTARVGLTGDTKNLLMIGGGLLAAAFILPRIL